MDVSFLTPIYNNEATLEAALRSFMAQRTALETEIIAVDDGSTDGSLAVARRVAAEAVAAGGPKITVVAKENGGEASALNAALERARGRYAAIAEADIEMPAEWLETCLAEFADPEVYGVGGSLVTPREDPWIARLAGYEIEEKFRTKERYPRHITSANAIYRREAFAEFGRFDENLVNACLDSVFNSRLIEGGKKLVFLADLKVKHHYKTTLAHYLRRQYAYARFRPHEKRLVLYPADRLLAANVGLCLAALASVCLLPFWPAVTGLLWATVLAMQVPAAARIWAREGDWAAALHPLVVVARNMVGGVGYGVGLWAKWRGERPAEDNPPQKASPSPD